MWFSEEELRGLTVFGNLIKKDIFLMRVSYRRKVNFLFISQIIKSIQ